MKDIATENFQRICEAYEILSDENKRQIYDIYGMEGLTSGLELGPKLNKAEEIKEQLEKLRVRKEQEKIFTHFRPSGAIVANMSLPDFVLGDGIMRGYISILFILLLLSLLAFICLIALNNKYSVCLSSLTLDLTIIREKVCNIY